MHFVPPQAFLTYAFTLRKRQDASLQVITHMIQMWCDRIDTSSEVTVVREEKLIAVSEGLGYFQGQQEGTTKAVSLCILLVFLQKFQFLTEACISDHLRCDVACVVAVRNGA